MREDDKEDEVSHQYRSEPFRHPFADFFPIDGFEKFLLENKERRPYDERNEGQDVYVENLPFQVGGTLQYHFHRDEKNNDESDPLDLRIPVEHPRDGIRSERHEDDGKHEPDSKARQIAMGSPRDGKHVVQAHGKVGGDDRPNGGGEGNGRFRIRAFVVLAPKLFIEFPNDVEKKESSGEFQSHHPKEHRGEERQDNTKNGRERNTEKDSLFSIFSLELPGRHSNEDGIVARHDDVDENDVREGEHSGGRAQFGKRAEKFLEEGFHTS
jgi:hypothetical protein